jgi:hypothetical protein
LAASTPLPAPGLNLTKLQDTFMLCGLENGSYHGWNLSNNSFDSILAHKNGGVTAVAKKDNFLLSGDRVGNI